MILRSRFHLFFWIPMSVAAGVPQLMPGLVLRGGFEASLAGDFLYSLVTCESRWLATPIDSSLSKGPQYIHE